MKRILLVLTMMMGSLVTFATDYTYLTFEKSDGSLTSVALSSLTITLSGTTLTAGGQTFALSDLKKMYFTTADVTAIDEIGSTADSEVEVFTLTGCAMGKYCSMREAMSAMGTGVYILKSKSKTLKVSVR